MRVLQDSVHQQWRRAILGTLGEVLRKPKEGLLAAALRFTRAYSASNPHCASTHTLPRGSYSGDMSRKVGTQT